MRKILFRGKRLDNGQWEYGNFNRINDKCYIFPEDAPDSFDNYEVDPTTVGQFTGLTDKNGKEIYEGDAVKYDYTPDPPASFHGTFAKSYKVDAVVEWSDTHHYLVYRRTTPNSKKHLSRNMPKRLICDFRISNIEIIGNIHENPELMKGGNQ